MFIYKQHQQLDTTIEFIDYKPKAKKEEGDTQDQ